MTDMPIVDSVDHSALIGAADRRVREVERFIRDEIEAASKAIRERYALPLRNARQARSNAIDALNDAAIIEGQSHPMLGKRVLRTIRNGRWGRGPASDQFGVVEMFSRESVLPDNFPIWRHPNMGAPIVRILKKDGTPGVKIEKLTAEWKAE